MCRIWSNRVGTLARNASIQYRRSTMMPQSHMAVAVPRNRSGFLPWQ